MIVEAWKVWFFNPHTRMHAYTETGRRAHNQLDLFTSGAQQQPLEPESLRRTQPMPFAATAERQDYFARTLFHRQPAWSDRFSWQAGPSGHAAFPAVKLIVPSQTCFALVDSCPLQAGCQKQLTPKMPASAHCTNVQT